MLSNLRQMSLQYVLCERVQDDTYYHLRVRVGTVFYLLFKMSCMRSTSLCPMLEIFLDVARGTIVG